MPTWLRSIMAVIVGLAAAFVSSFVVILLFGLVLELMDLLQLGSDTTVVAEIGNPPPIIYIVATPGLLVTSLTAGWVSTRIANRSFAHGLVTTGLLIIIVAVNMLSEPHSVWVWVARIAAYLVGGYTGAYLASRGKSPVPVPT